MYTMFVCVCCVTEPPGRARTTWHALRLQHPRGQDLGATGQARTAARAWHGLGSPHPHPTRTITAPITYT